MDASQINAETLSALKGLVSLFGREITFNRDFHPVMAGLVDAAREAIKNAEDARQSAANTEEASNG